jgi:integrase
LSETITIEERKKVLDEYDKTLEQNFVILWDQRLTYKDISAKLNIPFNKAVALGSSLQKRKIITARMTSRYKNGKILQPYTQDDFLKGMDRMDKAYCTTREMGLVALLYYSGVRKGEATRSVKDDYKLNNDMIFFNVHQRLKHGKETADLVIPLSSPYAKHIWDSVEIAKAGQKVFPFSKKTVNNICERGAFKYPHLFRLSRITNLFLQGKTIAEVQAFTGLSLRALDFYLGIVSNLKTAQSLS